MRSAFSTDFVLQPQAAKISGVYEHTIAPADPGTPAEQFELT